MTPQDEAALVIGGDLRFGSWTDDPAGVVRVVTGRAADARVRGYGSRAAEHDTHLACALIVAADNPYITRGATLDELVSLYGSGL